MNPVEVTVHAGPWSCRATLEWLEGEGADVLEMSYFECDGRSYDVADVPTAIFKELEAEALEKFWASHEHLKPEELAAARGDYLHDKQRDDRATGDL